MDVYELLKNEVPAQIFHKKKFDGNFLLVENLKMYIYYLNETASFVYEKIDSKRNIEEIKNLIIENFEVNKKDIEDELVIIFRDMQKQGIVKFI